MPSAHKLLGDSKDPDYNICISSVKTTCSRHANLHSEGLMSDTLGTVTSTSRAYHEQLCKLPKLLMSAIFVIVIMKFIGR
jgi:hypothetical protein